METHTNYFLKWLSDSTFYSILWFVVFGGLGVWGRGSLVPILYLIAVLGSSITSVFVLFRTVHQMMTDETFHGEPGPNA